MTSFAHTNKKFEDWIHHQRIDFLYKNAASAVVSSFLAILVVSFSLRGKVDTLPLVLWMVAGLLVFLVRVYLWYGYNHFRSRYSLDYWLNGYRSASLGIGVITGLGIWLFYDYSSTSTKVLLITLVIGFSGASVGAHSADKFTFQSFIFSACGLTMMKFLMEDDITYQGIGILTLLYISVLIRSGNQTFTTLTENFRLTYTMSYRATHDPLVGLLNREEFRRQFESLTPACDTGVAMLFIDLDNFKPLNDNLGHQAGDKALIEVANIILKVIRNNDIATRLGGDEFVILFHLDEVDLVKNIAKRIQDNINGMQFDQHGNFKGLSGSFGIAFHPNNNIEFSKLLHTADMACLLSKNKGKNHITIQPLE